MTTTRSLLISGAKKARKPALKKSERAGAVAREADESSLEASYARVHRILAIIALIQNQKGWNAKRLAQHCGVDVRSIYRDLNMLEGANIPYFYDPQLKCYQIRRDFFMKPIELTLDEALAIMALGEKIGGEEQVSCTRAAARVVAKIRAQLPDKIRRGLEDLEKHLSIKLAASSPDGADDVYERVQQAIAAKRALRCRYDAAAGQNDGKPFLFKPYALHFNQRAWYVVGFHDGRNGIRNLKLSRFTEAQLTDQPYIIPATFSLKKHLGHAWRMIRGPRKYEVELHFDAEFAETISDTHWHDTQQIQWNADDSITFRCKVDGLDEIVWWVLSMGPHCQVKAPRELADRVRGLAEGILNLYAAPGGK